MNPYTYIYVLLLLTHIWTRMNPYTYTFVRLLSTHIWSRMNPYTVQYIEYNTYMSGFCLHISGPESRHAYVSIVRDSVVCRDSYYFWYSVQINKFPTTVHLTLHGGTFFETSCIKSNSSSNFLLQMIYILFVGENAAEYQRYKMRQAIWNKKQAMPSWPEPVLHESSGKGAQWFAESNTIRVKFFCPTCPPCGSKNVILCFLANMKYST